MTTDKNSAREIAERIVEPSEERNNLTWEQIQILARAYLELEDQLERVNGVIPQRDRFAHKIDDLQSEIARLKDENERIIQNSKKILSTTVCEEYYQNRILHLQKTDYELKAENERLQKSLELALYYINDDATYESLKLRIDNFLSGKTEDLK